MVILFGRHGRINKTYVIMEPNTKFKDNDSLVRRLEHINGWINNCDQKSSILLAFLGVVLPLVVASDFSINRLDMLIGLIKLYMQEGEGCFCFYNALCLSFLGLSIVFAAVAIYYLLCVLKGGIDYKAYRGEGMESISALFFRDVAEASYMDYKNRLMGENYNSANDLISQIYVNSNICNRKFINYNMALRYICFFLCCFAITFILFLFL